MRTIVVNSTAARESGALTVLNQFLGAIAANNSSGNRYVVFVSDKVLFAPVDNVEFIAVDTEGWWSRIRWDNSGLAKYLNDRRIKPDVILSLQNMGVNYDGTVPQVIYFHQQLSIQKHSWNPLKTSERLYFLYQHIYPFFIRRQLGKVRKVFVQLDSIREGFSSTFNYPRQNIEVIRPDIPRIDVRCIEKIDFNDGRCHFFYPATPLKYKNHIVLVDALAMIGNRNDIVIHFTCRDDMSIPFVAEIHRRGLRPNVKFEGTMPYDRILSFYKSVDALLFPSYIETFGLPLVEAASFGLPVICSDLPYSNEVLRNYTGVEFVSHTTPGQWAEAIKQAVGNRRKCIPLQNNTQSEWVILFNTLNTI